MRRVRGYENEEHYGFMMDDGEFANAVSIQAPLTKGGGGGLPDPSPANPSGNPVLTPDVGLEPIGGGLPDPSPANPSGNPILTPEPDDDLTAEPLGGNTTTTPTSLGGGSAPSGGGSAQGQAGSSAPSGGSSVDPLSGVDTGSSLGNETSSSSSTSAGSTRMALGSNAVPHGGIVREYVEKLPSWVMPLAIIGLVVYLTKKK